MRFEKLKKEPSWDLSINTEAGDGSAPKSTPRKRAPKGTPKKTTKAEGSAGSDDDGSSFDNTPSKMGKGALNKVMSGRISKPRGKAGVASYAEDDDEDMAVKPEMDNGKPRPTGEPLAPFPWNGLLTFPSHRPRQRLRRRSRRN